MDSMMIKRMLLNGLECPDERHCLGMNRISECQRVLYAEVLNGRTPPVGRERRIEHEAVLHWRDVVSRLSLGGLFVNDVGRELVAGWDARLRGYIHGVVNGGDLLFVRATTEDGLRQVLTFGGVPGPHFEQMQMYLHYGNFAAGYVVYKVRSDGDVWVFQVARDRAVGLRLEQKARGVLSAVDAKTPPECECGGCK